MGSYYQRKGAGRRTKLESKLMDDIDDIIQKNDIEDINTVDSIDGLQDLRDKLKDEYDDVDISENEEKSTFNEELKSKPTSKEIEPSELDEAHPKKTENNPPNEPTESFSNLEFSDFEEIDSSHAFVGEFDPEDSFKIEPTEAPINIPKSDASDVLVDTPQPATPNNIPAWELKKQMANKIKTSERLGVLDDSAPEPNINQQPIKEETMLANVDKEPLSEDEEKKVALAKKTAKKATKSLARQSAKIFEWIVEFGVKKFTKISEKSLKKIEKTGEVDRNIPIDDSGKTIAQFVDEHNEIIDEIIKLDPDDRDDLVDAIMLVAEEQDIKASPMANLGMVVFTIMLSLGKAGYDQMKETKKLIRKTTDTYLVQTKHLADAHKEIAFLKKQQSTESPTFVNNPPTELKQLKFIKEVPKKPSIIFGKPEHNPEKERTFSEANAMIEEVNTVVDGEKEAKQTAINQKLS